MPCAPEFEAVIRREAVQPKMRERLVEHPAMHVVHVKVRSHLTDDALHRPAAPVVSDRVPVNFSVMSGTDPAQRRDDPTMPVEHRAAGVERQCLDVHLDFLVLWGRHRRGDGQGSAQTPLPCATRQSSMACRSGWITSILRGGQSSPASYFSADERIGRGLHGNAGGSNGCGSPFSNQCEIRRPSQCKLRWPAGLALASARGTNTATHWPPAWRTLS